MRTMESERAAVFRFVESAKDEMEEALNRAGNLCDSEKIMLARATSELHDVMWFLARARLTPWGSQIQKDPGSEPGPRWGE